MHVPITLQKGGQNWPSLLLLPRQYIGGYIQLQSIVRTAENMHSNIIIITLFRKGQRSYYDILDNPTYLLHSYKCAYIYLLMYLFLKIERMGGRVFLVFLGFPSPRPYISRQYSSTSTYLYIVTLEWNLKNSASGNSSLYFASLSKVEVANNF